MSDNGPQSRSPASLAFGVVSGDATARTSLGIVCRDLGRAASHVLYPQILGNYAALAQQFKAGSLHLAWTPPLVAVELVKSGAATLAVCSRRTSGTLYHSVLFGRPGLGAKTAEGLRDRTAAWVDRESLSGYLLARQWVRSHGVDPDALFGRQLFHHTHSEVARAVLRGVADVGATYANLDPHAATIRDAGWVEIGVPVDGVEVIATMGPIPADAVVIAKRVKPHERALLVDGLVHLPGSSLAAVRSLFHAEGFEIPPPGHAEAFSRLYDLF